MEPERRRKVWKPVDAGLHSNRNPLVNNTVKGIHGLFRVPEFVPLGLNSEPFGHPFKDLSGSTTKCRQWQTIDLDKRKIAEKQRRADVLDLVIGPCRMI